MSRDGISVPLRPATIADVPAMFAIRTAVTENLLTLGQLAALGITPASVAASLRKHCRAWVVEQEEGKIAAFAIADLAAGSIFALFTRPGFEGRGYGTALLDVATRCLFEAGATVASLTTGRDSPAAGFYRRRGWREAELSADGEVRFERSRAALVPSPAR